MDNLLRAYHVQQGGPRQVCEEFDPDLANAYIERRLAEAERSGYEIHLSGCAPCRKSVTALARMAEAETVQAFEQKPVAARPSQNWIAAIRRALTGMTAPQWAIAAAAVLILAVSVPLFLSRKGAQTAQSASSTEIAQSQASAPAQIGTAAEQNEAPAVAVSGSTDTQSMPAAPSPARPSAEPVAQSDRTLAASLPAAGPGAVASGEGAMKTDQLKAETAAAPAAPPVTGETASKSTDQGRAASSSVQPQAAPAEAELSKISPDEARRMQKEKDTAQMDVLRPGNPTGPERERAEVAIRPSQSVSPPPSPKTRAGGRLADGPSNSIAQGSLSETVRPPARAERKISGKKFWLRGEFWTDKDYNPGKDMPVVSLTRNSETYKEQLEKYPGLKPFFTGFGENGRVIVVYKGIVYKLVPE